MKRNNIALKTIGSSAAFLGKIIGTSSEAVGARAWYMVVGATYNEFALVRLFAPNEMNEMLLPKCCDIAVTLLQPEDSKKVTPFYADCSRLISKEATILSPILDSRANKVYKVSKKYLQMVLTRIKVCRTIPDIIKDKFLLSS